MACRVGAADDDCQPVQGRVLQSIVSDKTVEGAQLPIMGERFGARDVVRCGSGLLGDGEDALCRDVQELGVRFEETPDQPWTGDAVDLRTFPRDPLAHEISPWR